MDVCLIPCHSRPEFLWHCLRNIEKANGSQDLFYLFRPDIGHSPEVLEVIAGFSLPHEVLPLPADIRKMRFPAIMKQSWSVLTGYAIAAHRAQGGLVFYVEEDVMVAPDFFDWGKHTMSADVNWFCAIASEDTNTAPQDRPRHDGQWYQSQGTYRSIGVIWKAQDLERHLRPHTRTEYFLHPQKWLRTNFPTDPLRSNYCEQDGLIRRIQRQSGLPIAYPFEPKCYHAGYYGYNRRNRHKPTGSLQDRITAVGEVIYSHKEMQRVNSPAFYQDSKPCLTSAPTPTP